MSNQTIVEFLETQESEKIGLFAVDKVPGRPTTVRVHLFFGGEGVLIDTFIDIPLDAISGVEPTDQFGTFRGKSLRLVKLTFAEGSPGNIHLSSLFSQIRNNITSEDVNDQIIGNTPVGPKSRRADAVDAVCPRGQQVVGPEVSPFSRPIS